MSFIKIQKSPLVCCDCKKWKPLLTIGERGSESWVCEDCLNIRIGKKSK